MNDSTHLFFSASFVVWHTRVAIGVSKTVPQRDILGLQSSGWQQITYQEARRIPLPEQLLLLDPEWRKAGFYNWLTPLAASALRRVRHFEICNDFPGGSVVHFLRRYFSYHAPRKNTTYVISVSGDTEEFIISRLLSSGWREIGVARILTTTDIYKPDGKNSLLAHATMENELPLKVRAAIRDLAYQICTPQAIYERSVVVKTDGKQKTIR